MIIKTGQKVTVIFSENDRISVPNATVENVEIDQDGFAYATYNLGGKIYNVASFHINNGKWYGWL